MESAVNQYQDCERSPQVCVSRSKSRSRNDRNNLKLTISQSFAECFVIAREFEIQHRADNHCYDAEYVESHYLRAEYIILVSDECRENQSEVYARDEHKDDADDINPDVIVCTDAHIFCAESSRRNS